MVRPRLGSLINIVGAAWPWNQQGRSLNFNFLIFASLLNRSASTFPEAQDLQPHRQLFQSSEKSVMMALTCKARRWFQFSLVCVCVCLSVCLCVCVCLFVWAMVSLMDLQTYLILCLLCEGSRAMLQCNVPQNLLRNMNASGLWCRLFLQAPKEFSNFNGVYKPTRVSYRAVSGFTCSYDIHPPFQSENVRGVLEIA